MDPSLVTGNVTGMPAQGSMTPASAQTPREMERPASEEGASASRVVMSGQLAPPVPSFKKGLC